MNLKDVMQGSLQETKPALFHVQLSFFGWTVGHVGAWGYELTYKNRKEQEMGLLIDCQGDSERPAIIAAYKAIIKLKKKCRIDITTGGCGCLCTALEFGPEEDPELDGVPEWSKLLKALGAHSYYLRYIWPNHSWAPDSPLVTKVKQHAKAYLDTLPEHERSRLGEKYNRG